MNKLLIGAALAVAGATPAHALTVSSFDVLAGSTELSVVTATNDRLELDFVVFGPTLGTVTVTRDAGDSDEVAFNAFIEVLSDAGLRSLSLLFGDGEGDFGFVSRGTVASAFSTIEDISDDDAAITLLFTPNEYVSVDIGDVGFGGEDFILDLSGVDVGESFFIQFETVPAPATLALFGLAAASLLVARRRAI